MPQYMIVYTFTDEGDTVRNCTMFWTREELNHAVSVICMAFRGRIEIYTRCTENEKSFYKFRRAIEYTKKGGA